MRIIIIEDEPLIAHALKEELINAESSISILAILSSIKESIDYIQNNELPDLFFSDIQLSDGLSFEIFKKLQIEVPVIFCTAYDQYALEAFRANGIDYLLKPFSPSDIRSTIKKFKSLSQSNRGNLVLPQHLSHLEQLFQTPKERSILVHQGDRITPIKVSQIALASLDNSILYVFLFSGNRLSVNYNMETLIQLLGNQYYRVNRQHLIHRNAIKHVSQYFGRKLVIEASIPFPEKLIVSKAKAGAFLNWLETH